MYKTDDTVLGSVVPKSTNGAAHVRQVNGTSQLTKNRNINAAVVTYAEATNTATWTASDNVTEVVITPKSATAAGIQNDEFCLVCFDAGTEAIANAFFADTGGAASDVEYHIIPVAESRRFTFTSYLSRVDVLPLNDTMRVIVEAQ